MAVMSSSVPGFVQAAATQIPGRPLIRSRKQLADAAAQRTSSTSTTAAT
jgi:hypothetical protein